MKGVVFMRGGVCAKAITLILTIQLLTCAPAGYVVSSIPMYTPTQNLAVIAKYKNGVCIISLQYTGEFISDRSIGPKPMPSPPGIGSAVIDLAGFSSIDTVIVALKFSGLEQFRMQTEDSIYQVEIQKRPEEWRIYQSAASHSEGEWEILEPNSPFYTVIHIDRQGPLSKGHLFELELPKAIWQDTSKPFDISWINFYR